jgi:hypothetical protein
MRLQKKLVTARQTNSGQVCTCAERTFVERPVYDEFVRRYVEEPLPSALLSLLAIALPYRWAALTGIGSTRRILVSDTMLAEYSDEEIEVVLAQHPAVRECAVVLRQEDTREGRLVAYIVAASGAAVEPADLRSFVQRRLPDYMVPSVFVALDALPLTPNGKVDRKALPAPDLGWTGSSTPYVAPGTPLEETIAGVWSSVLGVERIGVDDNFFELGGDSLKAVILVARISTALAASRCCCTQGARKCGTCR